ncbi:MAG: arginyltransferase [Azoarcus sp.]|jgi:arginine-tRNA-protein transferase|nr:arginyltransferase [Azoarcus sp.]
MSVLETFRFYATAPYPCSYLPGRLACSQVAMGYDGTLDAAAYDVLMRHGFRRSGAFTYRPHCDHCHACLPVRLPVEAFTPNRSQRRAARQHGGLIARQSPLVFSEEHYQLYRRYLRKRHVGGNMENDGRAEYEQFLLRSVVETQLFEFRDPADGGLRMVSIIDPLGDGLSSVYTFFEPDIPAAAFGTYGVLWQIAACQQLHLPYLYLGYWIADCRKMNYKTRFRPIEVYRQGSWESADSKISDVGDENDVGDVGDMK